jgi:hypothetical protein
MNSDKASFINWIEMESEPAADINVSSALVWILILSTWSLVLMHYYGLDMQLG